ncbi:MAG: hypothetical protein ACYDBJ_17415 [Aggregatilineales bacterium]
MENLSARVKKAPVIGVLWQFGEMRPRLAAWIVLSLGIVILLLIEARDVGLLIGQWIALIIASILVAGLCIWIVSWEDSDDQPAKITAAPVFPPAKAEEPAAPSTDPGQAPPVAPEKP